jgi:hypothetical protein
MMSALTGKLQKIQKWLNTKNIENIIMIVTKIMINDLAMIVADHLRKITPTLKRAVQATTIKRITDKAHRSTMKRKDTKNKYRNL